MVKRGAVSERAFTLIELLVVVAIIALLISILLPSLNAAREQGKAIKCGANLKDVGLSMTQYTIEHRHYPALHTYETITGAGPYQIWFVRLREYWGEQHEIFHCPSQRPEYNWVPSYEAGRSRFPETEKFGYAAHENPVFGPTSTRAAAQPYLFGFAYGYNDRGSSDRNNPQGAPPRPPRPGRHRDEL